MPGNKAVDYLQCGWYALSPVLDLAEEFWETFPACYTAQKNVAFMKISSKCGSQKAPELPLDLTYLITTSADILDLEGHLL